MAGAVKAVIKERKRQIKKNKIERAMKKITKEQNNNAGSRNENNK